MPGGVSCSKCSNTIFLTASAIEGSINFRSAGRICIINLSLAPDHSGRAL